MNGHNITRGVVKSRIVARMWIGLGLISDKEDAQKISLHMIIEQLAHVACTQLLEESCRVSIVAT